MNDKYYDFITDKVNSLRISEQQDYLLAEMRRLRGPLNDSKDILKKFPGIEKECGKAIKDYDVDTLSDILAVSGDLARMEENIHKLFSSLHPETKLREKFNGTVSYWRDNMEHSQVGMYLRDLCEMQEDANDEKRRIEKAKSEQKSKMIRLGVISAIAITALILIIKFWPYSMIILGIILALVLFIKFKKK